MIGVKIFLSIGCLSVAIKLDGYIEWSWKEVFWWYWVVLSIFVGLTLALILLTVSKTV